MRHRKLVIIYVSIIMFLLLVGAVYYYAKEWPGRPDTLEPDIEKCLNAKGIWKEFPNGCVDSCILERSKEPVFCTQAFTFGCDCGEDKCWNGETCEEN